MPDLVNSKGEKVGHILQTPGEYTAWKPALEQWPEASGKVLVGCCNRLEAVENTDVRFFEPVLEYEDGTPTAGAYLGGWQDFRCKEGCGCTVNPGMKRTAHLRDGWYCNE